MTGSSTGNYRPAVVWSIAISCLLTVVSLRVPPSMYSDQGWGMLEWRTLADGGPYNTFIGPDPSDISKDLARFMPVWTPGQYMVPGLFMLMGFKEGTAFSLTSGVSLLCALAGWLYLMRYFSFSGGLAFLAVALISTFRYSTLPFGIYNGGEVLLQGAAPWILLGACRAPRLTFLRAVFLACGILLLGFFVKMTGIIWVIAALAGGAARVFGQDRRMTAGMAGAACGAAAGALITYAVYFSQTGVPSQYAWTPELRHVVLPFVAPWGAGISWSDMMDWLLRNPGRKIVSDSAAAWFALPIALAFGAILYRGRKMLSGGTELIICTVVSYAVYSGLIMSMRLSGFVISDEERHLRSAGTLIFICVLWMVSGMNRRIRVAAISLCAVMSLYGALSFMSRVKSTRPEEIDAYSGTRQPIVDMRAVDFVREGYLREGRDALFIVPSADVSSTLPKGARILPISVDFQTEEMLSGQHYAGKVKGNVYVLLQKRLDGSPRGEALLRTFANYPAAGWQRQTFGGTTVLWQRVD